MQCFINMSINQLLELQKEVKALSEIKEEITNDELIINYSEN